MKNKILWKFLGAYLPLILLAILVLNFFVSFSLRKHFEKKIADQLHSSSLLIGDIFGTTLWQNQQEKIIQQKVKDLGQRLNIRITIIGKNGEVLGDSEKNPQHMELHNNRPEVIDALRYGLGESSRYSSTLKYDMKYLATTVRDNGGVLGVIRLALPLTEVGAQIRVIYRAVLIGGIFAAFLMLIIGYFISRSITTPISEMRDIAGRIAKGDFSRKLKVKSKDELGQLAHSMNSMADELQMKISHLERMEQMKTDFVANVSHELKTPLTSIKGFIETLEHGAVDDKETAKRFMGIIRKHADSLSNIVDDLLSLSEIEPGKNELIKVPCDLKGILDEVILGFSHRLKGKNQQLTLEVKGRNFQLKADKIKLEQIFVNLIDNASKYTPEGGEIKITMDEQNDVLQVIVQDNGIGIPKEDLDNVFERFYRVDKARSRELGGTGLGLSIVKHIVALHKGTIDLKSEINKGTAITISFPKV